MPELIEILRQINQLSGAALDALEGASEGGAAGGAAPESASGGGAPVPPGA